MKNLKIIFITLFLIPVFILPSCMKDNNQLSPPVNGPTAIDFKINRLIKDFQSNLKSNLKESEEISIDSVIWYIEASLNETYARNDNTKELVWIDSAFVGIPLTSTNMVQLSDIDIAYDSLINALTQHYYAVTGEKGVLLIDIAISSVLENTLTLKMTDYVVNNPDPPITNSWTFGPGDDWYWGLRAGKCTDPGFQGHDAATQITSYANHSLLLNGNTQYFINLSNTGEIFPWHVPASSPNPFGYISTMLFYHSSPYFPEINDCLNPAAMNYYLDNLKQIALLPQYLPVGKSIANYYCEYDLTVDPDGWNHVHKAIITYGIPTVAPESPQDL